MDWSWGTGSEEGDEPASGFGPSSQGANHGDGSSYDHVASHDPGPDPSDGDEPSGDRGFSGPEVNLQDKRPQDERPQDERPQDERPQDERPQDERPQDERPQDERLIGFAPGGKWGTRPPSAELAGVLEFASGPERRCPGADYDEMVGLANRWAALESWAGAAKLGVVRALIRHEGKPWQRTDKDVDLPDPWTESLTHELALALASSASSAERTEWLAWELGMRLPGVNALLTDGTLNYGKARAIAEAFKQLSDGDAAHAEALIIGQLAGKTYLQVLRLATMAAVKVDPDSAERRRKNAEKNSARVELWREQSGAAALAGFDLPADETLVKTFS